MTCIAAVAQDGRVWMAADSVACNDYIAIQMADPKVFKVGELLFGVSGEHRVNQALRFGLTLPKPDPERIWSDLEWLVCVLVPALRECLRAAVMLEVVNGIERMGCDMLLLLGYRGHIYRIERDFVVIPCADSYYAAGSALEFALGSLHATSKEWASRVSDPAERAVLAVQAAAYHGRGVREPITVEVV